MTVKDYYRILKVSRTATQDEIRKAYRLLAREYHPDLNPSPTAENRFKALAEAYEILGNSAKRAEYDEERLRSRRVPPQTARTPREPGADFADVHQRFSQFQHHFRSARREPPPDHLEEANIEVGVLLSLEEAAQGGVHEVELDLPELGGKKKFEVRIPRGIRHGQKIRLKGQGASIPGYRGVGDLFLVVEIVPHPRFRVEGQDVHMVLSITPWEAALGDKVEVATLDGRIMLQIPAASSSGRKIRLRGKGFPGRNGQEDGDLLVELRIAVPEHLTEMEHKLFTQLARHSTFNPRE